ncbi:MAG: DUF4783 domain-containing protein [Chitinophagales bacterium]|jgi:hypothetical protein|nr:DUF4783 domain-containing protein [Sphingobacteriales bacterium]MBP9140205.1 DUF4783 domain-containing protein [Chitinophagales bacterium]MDA0197661.1 DUF4783 domain-containing protein [Bacteroidota bacterium]MBK6888980.1 DUF4783 domain-containing protein [Sphingobacteriales bacterium]MBK8679521.1 DUF4783 domain-containing protein [Sphingobacteriales bacterium]
MKHLLNIFVIVFISLLASFSVTGQDYASALRTGNATALTSALASTIDIALPSSDGSYTTVQATQVLQQFFNQVQPTGFSVKHSVKAPNGSNAVVGQLNTKKGVYRVNLVLANGKIDEISFKQ